MHLDGQALYEQIQSWIIACVAQTTTDTAYRVPLVAAVSAHDPQFAVMPARVPGHLVPQDLLPSAQSVCAFFVPFDRSVIASNKGGREASEEWARAYVETNALLSQICELLAAELSKLGIAVAWAPPTHNFDSQRLVSVWSHKSIAAIAGLGKFGYHCMLITAAGCAGRLGSIVLDAEIVCPPRTQLGEVCAFGRGCRACVQCCPVGALTEAGFDRYRCYEICLENDARFPIWLADVCGKCATGPCAMRPFGDGTGTGLAA